MIDRVCDKVVAIIIISADPVVGMLYGLSAIRSHWVGVKLAITSWS
jgi:hypothetical protein